MRNAPPSRILLLLERLCRLADAERRSDDLNPAQGAALGYLARANRFSRSPSQVAEYLSTTRGTASQTLKALARKGFIEENRCEGDRRAISYDVTGPGSQALGATGPLRAAIGRMRDSERERLAVDLSTLLARAVTETGGRTFGLCKTCRHHRENQRGRYCGLLELPLAEPEAEQICYEHA